MSKGRRTNRTRPSAAQATRSVAAGPPSDIDRRAPAPAVVWLVAALILITLVAYAPVRHHGFVSIDDGIYVTGNAHVKGGLTWPGVAWAFTSSHANFWHPLTWLSLMLDVQLFGVNAGMLHVTNVLLHIASTLLLFLVLRRMTGAAGRSAFVAAMFAVHPLHVESVAWIAERKDTLSTVFWMLTLWAYVGYVRRPRWHRYLLVAVLFALGLMAKPMLVTLPFVLLLLDVWPLRRIAHPFSLAARAAPWVPLVREKLPLFALAAASSVVAFVTQQSGGAVADRASFPFAGRVANALQACVTYVIEMVWPARLVPFYPYPQAIALLPTIAALIVLVGVSILVTRLASRRPYLAVGWFWYIGTLLPVAGLVQVGSHAMADRYTYVPLIGLFIIAAWAVPDLLACRRRARLMLPVVASALIVAAVVTTRAQVMTWRNNVTLWQHALDVMPDNYYAHNAVGLELQKQGRIGDAMAHFVESSRLAPGFPNAHENLGLLLAAQGRTSEAIDQYHEALRVAPNRLQTHILLGNVLLETGRAEEGVAQYQEAIRVDPDFADAHYNLGNAVLRMGRLEQAVAEYHEALRLQPGSVETHNNLGATLEKLGRPADAIAHYEESLRLDPDSANARCNLGNVLLATGRLEEAAAQYREALRVDPRSAQAHTNLGSALQDMGRLDEAVAEHHEAIRLNPDFADAHYNLANALALLGRLEAAAAQYRETLRLEGDSAEVRNLLAAVLKKMGQADSPGARPTVRHPFP
jgi:tetratricopeptide (TPR) repeat protein